MHDQHHVYDRSSNDIRNGRNWRRDGFSPQLQQVIEANTGQAQKWSEGDGQDDGQNPVHFNYDHERINDAGDDPGAGANLDPGYDQGIFVLAV